VVAIWKSNAEGIPTFIIDWPVLLLIGVIFGFGVKGAPDGSVLRTRAFVSGFLVVALFSALVYYSYLLAPDWMFNYFTKASAVPSWMIPYIFALYFAAYAAGFVFKFELAKMGKGTLSFAIVVLILASALVPISLGTRYTMVGSMDQFLAGQALPLPKSPVGKVPGNLTLALLPLGILLLLWSRKQRFSLSSL